MKSICRNMALNLFLGYLFLSGMVLIRIPNAIALEFHGYTCTDDCSGHEAGYEWAGQNGITDASECSGNSQSFIEGCQAYADENGGLADEEMEEDLMDE